ncbi:MAG: hypothetical protein NTW97_02880 [Candidatus Krumholzibacteria bacterium]|nr:hypothetical protein [Candidatus Krumholzibacteria bacterium]
MRSTMACFVSVFLMLGACSSEQSTIVNPGYPIDVKEDLVRSSCQKVREAADAFAAENGGEYPLDLLSDTTGTGRRFIDFLPGGRLLANPFTGENTEPTLGTADSPGEIAYRVRGFCQSWGYWITGFGGDSTIVELTNAEELEDSVRLNCYIIQAAVERFAMLNGGIYPSDVDADCTPDGETVIDLLPEGCFLVNPFTLAATEPVNASAANAGETGYTPVVMCGINSGYTITGVGGDAGTVILVLSYEYVPDGCGSAADP